MKKIIVVALVITAIVFAAFYVQDRVDSRFRFANAVSKEYIAGYVDIDLEGFLFTQIKVTILCQDKNRFDNIARGVYGFLVSVGFTGDMGFTAIKITNGIHTYNFSYKR